MDRDTDVRLFSRRPKEEDREYAIPLRRVKGSKPISLVLCAHDVIGRWTHFDGRRTRPCRADDCELCIGLRPRSFQAWIPAVEFPGEGRCFLQMPLSGVECFDRHLQKHGSAERWQVQVCRVGDEVCGTVHVRFLKPHEATWPMPAFPSTVDYLYRLWGLRYSMSVASGELRRGDMEDLKRQLDPSTTQAAVDDVIATVKLQPMRRHA